MARKVTEADLALLRTVVRRLAADPAPAPRAELAAACRAVCLLLAERYPGGTVELRVPPFAAVQLGIGERGRHTRGTPPNVVQTDPDTLLRLAAGLLSWEQARNQHRVESSGIYAEIATVWPLPELTNRS